MPPKPIPLKKARASKYIEISCKLLLLPPNFKDEAEYVRYVFIRAAHDSRTVKIEQCYGGKQLGIRGGGGGGVSLKYLVDNC